MESYASAMFLLVVQLQLQCGAQGSFQSNQNLTSTSVLRLLQSEASSVAQCSHYMTSQVSLDIAVFQWLSEHSRGLSVFEQDFMTAQNSSFLRKYWKTSFCTILLTAGSNALSSMDLLQRVTARNKVLVILFEGEDEYDSLMGMINSKIWSFDVVMVASESVRIFCQGVGNIPNIAAKHLHECSDVVLPALSRSHIQISGGARVPYILTSGGPVRGPDIEIIRLLQRKFLFRYDFKPEANFGIDKFPNGTTFGLLASLGKRESDIGVGELLANPDRHKYVDFSTPTYYMEIVFATPKPKKVSAFLTIFYPMDKVTWAATAVTLILVTLVLLLVDGVYFGRERNSYKFYDVSIAYSMLLQYNAPHSWFSFKSFQSRTLLLCFWLPATFFISSGYKSVLLAKLTLTEHEKAIDTPQDILRSGLPVLIPNQTAPQFFVSGSMQPDIQKVYRDLCLSKNGLVPFNGTYPAWVWQLLNNGRAILVDDALAIDQSKLHIASVAAGSQNSHVLYPLNSRLAPLIDQVLRQAKAMGLLQKFLSDFTSSSTNTREGAGYAQAVTVEHFIPVILLELLGVVLAVIVFVGLELPRKRRPINENMNMKTIFVKTS